MQMILPASRELLDSVVLLQTFPHILFMHSSKALILFQRSASSFATSTLSVFNTIVLTQRHFVSQPSGLRSGVGNVPLERSSPAG